MDVHAGAKINAKRNAPSLQVCKCNATIIGGGLDCRSAGSDMDKDLRVTYLALVIIIIVCTLALSIAVIVER